MEILKQEILEKLFHLGVYDNRKLSFNKTLIEKIKKTTQFLLSSASLSQRVWHIVNTLKYYPLCSGGNERRSFISFTEGYRASCHLKRGECPSCLSNFNQKRQDTCRKKYGVDSLFASSDFQDKRKKTCLERYGVDSFSKTSQFQEQSKQTCLERYGVENPFQSDDFQDKRKKTCLERYGVEHQMFHKPSRDQWYQTCLERYGSHPYHTKKAKEKSIQTNLERYGVGNISQKHILDILPNLQSKEWWNSFNSISEIIIELNNRLSISNIYLYINRFRPDLIGTGFTISTPHQKIINLLKEHQIPHEINSRKIISPLELDIFIPSKNLAIEINGVYWHSEIAGGKSPDYHLTKTLECEQKGIKILQFWDTEILEKWDIVASMILNQLGEIPIRIGARECKVIEVSKENESLFLNSNHLQGYRPSSVCLGLIHENELVSLMSFGKPRYSNQVDWELIRFCNSLNTQVTGGASKLFKSRPKGSVVSYSDRRYSQGKLYEKLGMVLKGYTNPAYHYTKDHRTLENRMKYQKHKLPKLLEAFNPSLTEWENMVNYGYDRVWDCGNMSFYKE